LRATLGVLQQLELILETARTPDLAYMFKHAVTHEVAYSTLLRSERRQMHRTIGEAIEELYRERVADQVEVLAYHFSEAEDWGRALDYTVRAGDKAAAAFANQAALDSYAAALDLCARLEESPERVATVALSRGMVNINIGDWAAGRLDFRAMYAASPADAFLGPLALGLRGVCEQFEHSYDQAEQSFRAVLDITAAGGSDDVRLLAAGQLTLLLRVTDRFDEAAVAQVEAQRLMAVAQDPLFRSWWGWTAAVQTGWTGDFDGAIAHACEARRIAAASDVMMMTLFSMWAEGLSRAGRGEYQQALDVLHAGLAECERVGDTQAKARILNTLGWIYGEVENHREANEWNHRAVALASSGTVVNSAELETYSRLNLGESLLALGDLDAATEEFVRLEHRSRHPRAEDLWMHWRWSQHLFASYGDLHLQAGRPDAALPYVDECLQLAERSESKKYIAKARRLRAEALLRRGQQADARQDIDVACAVADSIRNPAQQWKAHAGRADVLQAQGEIETAHHEREVALSIVADTARGLDDDDVRTTFLGSDQVTRLRTAIDHRRC
jgi:tetratricopeptide (TPR) repeat protein